MLAAHTNSTLLLMAKKDVIASLGAKIDRLIADNQRLYAENEALMQRRERLASDNRELKQTVVTLEKRIGILELGKGIVGEGVDTKKAQMRINRLMREIDRCIALINK